MGCGTVLVKYTIFLSNLVFALAGLALLGLGIALELRIKAVVNLIDGYQTSAILCIVLGAIVFLIAFFGCCGAIKENNCMLTTYSCIMLLIIIATVALAVMTFIKRDDSDLTKGISEAMNTLYTSDKDSFYIIQSTLKCCGKEDPLSTYPLGTQIPASCCDVAPCIYPTNIYMDGCNQTVLGLMKSLGLAMGLILIVIAALELVAVTFALCLANNVRNKSRRTHY